MRIRSTLTRHDRKAVVLGLALTLTGWVTSALAEQPEPGERILLGAIINSCKNDDDSYREIAARLRQLGATVETPGMGPTQCVGLDCASKLKGEAGYLLGGQVSLGQSSLWLVDLAKDQVLIQRHAGYGVDKPVSLARQAAGLVEKLNDPQSSWVARSQVLACGSTPAAEDMQAATNEKGGMTRAEPKIVLAVHAPPLVGKYANDFQKGVRRSLSEMGLQVREVRGVAPPTNPREALPVGLKDLPLIDVQLLAPEHEKKSTAPDGAIVRLSDGHRATQASIDCAAQDCEPAQLVQFVRRNAAALLDRGIEAEGPGAAIDKGPAACVPVNACVKIAQAPEAPQPPLPEPDASDTRQPLPQPMGPEQTQVRCPPQDRRMLIAGGTLVGVGVAAMLAFGITYGVLDGRTEVLPSTSTSLFPVAITHAKPALIGVVLGGASAVTGGILIGLHYRSQNRNKNAEGTCAL